MKKDDILSRNDLLTGSLCALGCEILYGMSYVFTKQAIRGISELSLLSWRFALSFIAMNLLLVLGVIKVDIKAEKLKPLLSISLFCPVIYFIGETIGINHTTASESGVFLACIPVASLMASSLLLKKKPSGLQITGILITLAGVLVTVFAAGASPSFSMIGYIFLLLAVFSYALYSVHVDKAAACTGIEITYMMITAGAVVFIILAFAEALAKGNVGRLVSLPFADSGFMIAVIYQGIGCSILAFFLSNIAIARIGVNRTSSFVGVSTVVSIIAGGLFLQERLPLIQIIGAGIIITGVYTANAGKIKYTQ